MSVVASSSYPSESLLGIDPALIEQLDGEADHLIICKHKETRGGSGKLYSLSLSSLNNSENPTETAYATQVKNLRCRGVPPVQEMPLPACHGLILLSHFEPQRTWAVWNPFTMNFIELPPYSDLTKGHFSSGGIGYDAFSGDFKVVRISGIEGGGDDVLETLIYSTKSNTWRRIQDYPNCIFNDFLLLMNKTEHGVYFNGALYWFRSIKQVGGQEGQMLALDIGTEEYRQISGPFVSSGSECLVASGGCLFVSDYSKEQFDVWMLNELGEGENIWTKFVSLHRFYNADIRVVKPRLVSYSRNKREVVIRSGSNLFWYDVEKKCMTKVSIQGVEGSFSCQAIPLSSSSSNANETTTSEGSQKKRKRTSPGDRLILKLKTTKYQIPPHAED